MAPEPGDGSGDGGDSGDVLGDAGGVVSPQPSPIPDPQPEPIPVLLPAELIAIVCAPEFAWDCGTAQRIVWCESRGHPDSTNGISYGLWQIWSGHAPYIEGYWEHWSDPWYSTQWAYGMYVSAGYSFRAWDCW